MSDLAIRPLRASAATSAMLADLLVETVAHGGSVSFMHPLSLDAATAFWDASLSAADRDERVVLGAWDGDQLVATVTLLLDLPPNQPHRAEIAKMMTRVSHRGRGLASALLREAEAHAMRRGRTLLVLDTATDGGASVLYQRLGYTLAGEVPDFAVKPNGGLTGTKIYWKRLPEARTEADRSTVSGSAARVTLRPATGDDALCIGVLGTQVFLDNYATDGIRPALAREVLDQFSTAATATLLAAPDTGCVVAERGGHLVGFALWSIGAAHALVTTDRPAKLERLYVQEPFVGTGLGTSLLVAAERGAAAAGADTLWLTSWVGNRRALAFYPRRGYADVGATVYAFEHEEHENRVFMRSLAGRDRARGAATIDPPAAAAIANPVCGPRR